MFKKIISSIKLYIEYISINIRSMMQYKMSFFLSAIGQFLISFNAFLGIFFMFKRFPYVNGFTYSEVLLCFSVVLMEFSLAELFARGFDSFSGMVRTGEFDRILVRPKSEIIQVLGSKFELTRIGRILQAVVMFIYGITKSNVIWDIPKIFTLIFMLAGGTAVFSGIFLIQAAFCFFTLEGLEFMNVFTDGAREFGKYPLEIYGKKFLIFATFIIPYSLIQYYPLLFILGQRKSMAYMILPLIAVLFLIPAVIFWKIGVRHYKSSGS